MIERERELAIDFRKFGPEQQLQLLDSARKQKMKREQERQNNVKWQINGVLSESHQPLQHEDLQDNFGFKSDVLELEKQVELRKKLEAVMSRMGDFKLNALVLDLEEKLGLVTRKRNTEQKVMKFVAELYESKVERL